MGRRGAGMSDNVATLIMGIVGCASIVAMFWISRR